MVVGISIIALPLGVYSTYVNSIAILDVQSAPQLEYFSYTVILLTIVGLLLTMIGVCRFLQLIDHGERRPRTFAAIARVFQYGKYRSVMASVGLMYGIIFAFVSGMVVYRPMENFAAEYFVAVPSSIVAVCCGSPGFVPVLTIFLTEHLGLLIIPADMILLALVSWFVGLNAMLVAFQYDNRPRPGSRRWLLGVGAACGLFTACPTCAGLMLSSIVLGAGSSAAVVLSGMQPIFIVLTLFALAIGTVLSARTIRSRTERTAGSKL